MGSLTEIKIDSSEKMGHSHKSLLNATPAESHKSIEKPHFSHPINADKVGIHRQDSINKQAIIDRIEEIRRNALTPKAEGHISSQALIKKSESLILSKEK